MNISFDSNMTSLANPRVRRQKFGVGSLIILLVFGVIFTATGLLAVNSSKINPSWPRVSGKVVSSSSYISNGSTTYTPVVQYQVNGKSYQVTAGSGSSFYPQIGSPRQVAYNPSQPQEAKVVSGAGTKSFLYLFPAIGIACLVIAPIAFVKSMRRGSNIHSLVQTGQKLQGVITDIQTSYGNNNNNTYRIVVSAADNTGSVQSYVSDRLMGIGGLAMADFRNNPIPIDVYVNPSNPQDYYVDVSEVPNLTPERIGELIKTAAGRQTNTFAQGEQPNQLPQTPQPQPVVTPQPMPAPQPPLPNVASPTPPDNNDYPQPPTAA